MRKFNCKRNIFLVGLICCVFCSACGEKSVKEDVSVATTSEAASDFESDVSEEVLIPEESVFVEPEVDLLMVGDILLHDNVQNSGKLSDGTYNYDHLFANVIDDIQAADVAIANQEVILGGRELGLSGYPRFNGAYEVGDALVKAGFDVILHATNHTMDKEKEGLIN
jgi:poly-gamma-glutamate synthesis protein (capsule biosynthesis protein)